MAKDEKIKVKKPMTQEEKRRKEISKENLTKECEGMIDLFKRKQAEKKYRKVS